MIIIYGDYLDMNHHSEFETSKTQSTTQEEADCLRPYWDKFESGQLNLREGRITRTEWEEYTWIDVCNYWFEPNGYTVYTIIKPSTRPPYSEWQKRTSKWFDRDNKVIVTECFNSRVDNPPKVFEDYIEKMRKYTADELKRVMKDWPSDLGKEIKDTCENMYQKSLRRWQNKKEARWFHPWPAKKQTQEVKTWMEFEMPRRTDL